MKLAARESAVSHRAARDRKSPVAALGQPLRQLVRQPIMSLVRVRRDREIICWGGK
jgi:hypothetical protein